MRAFLIGAGMSMELGAPSVSGFLRQMRRAVAPAKRRHLEAYLRGPIARSGTRDIEALLASLENPTDWPPVNRKRYAAVRRELLQGIAATLAEVHYKWLERYDLPRRYDLYHRTAAWIRRIFAVRRKYGLADDEVLSGAAASILDSARRDFKAETDLKWEASRTSDLAATGDISRFPKDPDPYALLMHAVSPGDAVITTNYDLCLDFALGEWANERPIREIVYGTEFVQNRTDHASPTSWSLEDAYTPEDRRGRFVEPQSKVALYKLHGSIDWLLCQWCERVILAPGIPVSEPAIRYIMMRDYESLRARPRSVTFCCERFSPASCEPHLIAPTPKKAIRGPVLSEVWEHALGHLREVDELVFIGYSLRPTDSHVTDLIVEGCRARRPKITVVDRNPTRLLKARYATMAKRIGSRSLSFWKPTDDRPAGASAWCFEEARRIRRQRARKVSRRA